MRVHRAKTKVEQLEKNLSLNFFFQLNFFGILLQVSKHNISLLNSKLSFILQEKFAKFKLGHQKIF